VRLCGSREYAQYWRLVVLHVADTVGVRDRTVSLGTASVSGRPCKVPQPLAHAGTAGCACTDCQKHGVAYTTTPCLHCRDVRLQGTYNGGDNQDGCTKCDYGFTTALGAGKSKDDCWVAPGHGANGTVCPIGMWQLMSTSTVRLTHSAWQHTA
jgi:hypothetical protein